MLACASSADVLTRHYDRQSSRFLGALRNVASDLERLAATAERHEVSAVRLREAAAHYAGVAENMEGALKR
jgi:hypothetical protein